jgi:tetratricopeptide (TPR) repeat protein
MFDKDYLEEQAPVLSLIGSSLIDNPMWSLKLLDTMSSRLLLPMYRQERDNAPNLSQSIAYAEIVVDKCNGGFEDLLMLAHMLSKANHVRDALYRIDKAIVMKPDDPECHRFRASILERMGQFWSAREAIKLAISLSRDKGDLAVDLNRINTSYYLRRLGLLRFRKFLKSA